MQDLERAFPLLDICVPAARTRHGICAGGVEHKTNHTLSATIAPLTSERSL